MTVPGLVLRYPWFALALDNDDSAGDAGLSVAIDLLKLLLRF